MASKHPGGVALAQVRASVFGPPHDRFPILGASWLTVELPRIRPRHRGERDNRYRWQRGHDCGARRIRGAIPFVVRIPSVPL